MADKKKKSAIAAEYPNLYEGISNDDLESCMSFAEDYKSFLDISKTEREFVINSIEVRCYNCINY